MRTHGASTLATYICPPVSILFLLWSFMPRPTPAAILQGKAQKFSHDSMSISAWEELTQMRHAEPVPKIDTQALNFLFCF